MKINIDEIEIIRAGLLHVQASNSVQLSAGKQLISLATEQIGESDAISKARRDLKERHDEVRAIINRLLVKMDELQRQAELDDSGLADLLADLDFLEEK